LKDATTPIRRVAVLGGGISGLSAAYTLACARQAGEPIAEFLIEALDRLGGVISTERIEGFVIEAGPDSFLAEKPEAAALCRELGLGESLLGSNDDERRTYILQHGRLVPLPDGLMFLVPTRIWPMVTTPLLPLRAKLSMALEWFAKPRREEAEDESVADFVTRHFGQAMLEYVADPLLAGVYGGDSRALSVRSVLPRFWEMERQWGSLTRATLGAMRHRRQAISNNSGPADSSSPGGRETPQRPLPLFMTLKGGLDQLPTALADQLDQARVYLGRQATSLEPASTQPHGMRKYRIHCEGSMPFDADAVILAMPAHACGRILSPLNGDLSALLQEIPYNSSMTVSLAYDAHATSLLPPGFGFLVPRKENRRMLACTFVHGKFRYRVPEGQALLRCFFGGARDPGVLDLSNEEIVAVARRELREILDFSPEPRFARVYRWPASMAQYEVGHAARLAAIRQELQTLPGVFLAGNAYSGIGISDCVRSGRVAGKDALEYLANGSARRCSVT